MDPNQIAIGQSVTDEQFNSFDITQKGVNPHDYAIGEAVTDEQFKNFGTPAIETIDKPVPSFEKIPVGQSVSDEQFNNMIAIGEKPSEKSSSWLKDYAKGAVDKTSRVAGVALGTLNSPLALAWGAANAKNIDPEEYKKLPHWKKELYSIGKGLESAWESISKEGEWGTLYGEYFKGTTGKTIEQTLPDKLKWAAPTVEFLGNIISDPLVSFGTAGQLAALKMAPGAKNLTKSFPKGVIKELEKFDQLQAAEKQALQKQLMDILKQRKGYIKWWDDQIKNNPKLLQETGQPLLKPGERAIPDLTAPRSAMAGQPKREFATAIESTAPEKFTQISDIAKTRPKPSIAKFKREKAVSDYNVSRAEAGLEPIKLQDVESAAAIRTSNNLEQINEFRKTKGLEPIPKAKFKAHKYTHAPMVKSTAGMVYGIEEDEQGNITFNVKKGLVGALIVAGGVSVVNTQKVKQFAKTMARNPAWADVASTIGKEKRSFEFVGLFSRLNSKFFDRFGPLKKASPEGYKQARIFSSYKDVAKKEFDELVTAFKPVKNDEALITHYITAHRYLTRAQRGIQNPVPAGKSEGVTVTKALNSIKEMEAEYLASGKNPQVLKDALGTFQQWGHDKILRPLYDGGIISKESYASIVKNNEWYAAFDVLEKLPADINKIPSGIGGEYFSVTNQKIVRAMVGTKKQIANPIESTIKKFTQAKATIAKNKVASTFLDDPNIQKNFARPVSTSAKEHKIMQQQGKNPVMQGNWSKKEFDTINRFKDGKVERYIVDKVLADAMKQLTPWQAPGWLQGINAVFRASATTLYLPFTISNAMRDGLMAYATAPVYKATRPDKFVKDWAKGFWEGAKHEFLGKSDLVTEYIGHGGGFGYVGNLRQAKRAKAELFKKGIAGKAVTVIKSPFDLIEKISATIELAPRVGLSDRGNIAGMSGEAAALMGRQSTIDFNRGGVYTKVANQFVPFLNARVQARVTFANALKNTPKNTLAKTFTAAVLPGLSAYAWNRTYYSELYDDIPEYIKQNYFTMIYGKDKNKYGKTIPKYFVIAKGDLGQMAFNPIEFGLDDMLEKNPATTKAFLIDYLSDLSPVQFARQGKASLSKTVGGLSPPIAKGFAEDWANLKFYQGTEIVPYYMGKSKPPELQYKESTPESYKLLGKKIGISPLRIQNFASNILAGYGREGLDPSAMLRGLTGRIVKTKGGEIENRAWTVVADIEQGYVDTRAYAEELIKNDERKAAMKLIVEWNKNMGKRLKEYNKEFKKYNLQERGGIRRSYTFTPEKIKNLLMKRKQTRSPLEQRLTVK